MKNAHTKETVSTKEKLTASGMRLFAKYGYCATTTRMIADEVGINVSTLVFHIGGKEKFYKAILEHTAELVSPCYDEIYLEIEEAKRAETLSPEEAWGLITKLIDSQLHIALDKPIPEVISLLYWEQMDNIDGFTPITDIARTRCEEAMAFLLTKYQGRMDMGRALIVSRLINGGIVSLPEHPAFLQMIKSEVKGVKEEELGAYLKDTIRPFILSNIAHYCESFSAPPKLD